MKKKYQQNKDENKYEQQSGQIVIGTGAALGILAWLNSDLVKIGQEDNEEKEDQQNKEENEYEQQSGQDEQQSGQENQGEQQQNNDEITIETETPL